MSSKSTIYDNLPLTHPERIWEDVRQELARAKKKHPNYPTHVVARAGIICEEAGEMVRETLNLKYEVADGLDRFRIMENLRREAIQVAAAAIRFLENLK